MTDIAGARSIMQIEESSFNAALGENFQNKQGANINFIHNFQHSDKRFNINGPYIQTVGVPFDAIDGFAFFEFNATIINAWMYSITAGASGTTELDIKLAASTGGVFSSIFSTTPKISSAAPDNSWLDVSTGGTGLTQPLFTGAATTLDVDQGDAIKMDLITSMTGAIGCGLVLHYRPR